jgi:4-hydroxy-3-methylbut-2-enyl diphosphate reductase
MGDYQLKVTIDQDSGFCFGVVYAIDMAEEILAEDGYLYCLGDIVHNDEEVERLKALGLRIIEHAELAKTCATKKYLSVPMVKRPILTAQL